MVRNEDIKGRDHNRHHQEEETKVIWSHLQNGVSAVDMTCSTLSKTAGMEKSDPVNGWPQRAVKSLRDMMMMMKPAT
jgi:hypothetical protein